jgi:hypothetical protein
MYHFGNRRRHRAKDWLHYTLLALIGLFGVVWLLHVAALVWLWYRFLRG